MSEEIRSKAETRAEERLPWHKPEVQHIVISMTRSQLRKEGSEEDLEIKTTTGHYLGS